jgi:hypothetical protein
MSNLKEKQTELADLVQLELTSPCSPVFTHTLTVDQMPVGRHISLFDSAIAKAPAINSTQMTTEFVFQGDVRIVVDKDGVITFSGYKKLVLSEDNADVEILGKNVKISAKHHVEIEAPRVDVNPDKEDYMYQWYVSNG